MVINKRHLLNDRIAKKKDTIVVGRDIICHNEHSKSPKGPASPLWGEKRLKNSKVNLKS